MGIVRKASRWEYDAVARLLADVFVTDPTIGPWVAGRQDPAGTLADLFGLQIHEIFDPAGAVDVAVDGDTGDLLGAALWAGPGGWHASRVKEARLTAAYARILGRSLPVMLRSEAASSTYHPAFPHWYLFTAGAGNAARGRGVGTALLAAGLARADDEERPTYLEATTPASARLYARLGFVRLGEIPNPYGDTRAIGMWRPAPGGDESRAG